MSDTNIGALVVGLILSVVLPPVGIIVVFFALVMSNH